MIKFIEFIVELLGWVRIAISPTLIAGMIGAAVYISSPTDGNFIIAAAILMIGIAIGAIWATRIRRTKGTIYFLTRNNSSSNTKPSATKKND